jgi:hypothetical protein
VNFVRHFPQNVCPFVSRFCRVAEAFFTRHHHQHLSKEEEEAVLVDVAVAAKVAAVPENYQ